MIDEKLPIRIFCDVVGHPEMNEREKKK